MNPYFVTFIRTLSKIALRIMGFTVHGNLPDGLKKFVVIGAPHTANIDFVLALSWLQFKDVRPMYLAKETVFYPPYGWFFRMIGGISDNRKRRQKGEKTDSVVDIVVAEFEKYDNMVFGIMPEGGRKVAKRWKMGFYQIAVRANVPIVITTFDYAKKEITHAAVFYPTGDVERDMPIILSYYKNVTGKNPEKFMIDERYM